MLCRLGNNYNIQTELHFWNQSETNSFLTEFEFFFQKPNGNQTEILKNLFRTSLVNTAQNWPLWRLLAASAVCCKPETPK